jgi:hypothetical protein
VTAVLLAGAAHAETTSTPSLMGSLGLNTVPDARFDKTGTIRLQASALDPYMHGSLGVQIAKPVYIGIRQTAEVSHIGARADRLYPGIDLKLKLLNETAHMPAVALGLQSATGHRRMAAEYVALSKRLGNFDVTGGMGWGRMGSHNTVGNPFKLLSTHFAQRRDIYGESPNGPAQWFTGDAALFGGVAWDTPLKGLKLKADWNGDAYLAERTDPDFHRPQPWSAGFSYSPKDWITFGMAWVGGNKIFGTLSFQSPMERWFGRPASRKANAPFPAHRSGDGDPKAVDVAASGDGILTESKTAEPHTLTTRLMLRPGASLPMQLGEAVSPMARQGGADIESFEIQPAALGLSGPSVRLTRRDLEQALAHDNGSPQEIWRGTRISEPLADASFPDNRSLFGRPIYYGLIVDTKASLSEDDHGTLYRTGIVFEAKHMLSRRWLTGQALRLNIADNLQELHSLRPYSLLPVRSDEDLFAAKRLSVERSYVAWTKSLNADWHAAVTAGYLEEMSAGIGGEILYRPFGKTYAIGAEAWEAMKRDPLAADGMGLNGDHLLTGHIKAWYEIPGTDMTVQAKVGRYLAEDIGATLGLTNTFKNGAKLEAFATVTNKRDENIFGGSTALYSGMRFRLPIGNLPLVPDGSEARFTAAPIGRNTGQAIDNPLPLYELTDQISYRTIADHWGEITEK